MTWNFDPTHGLIVVPVRVFAADEERDVVVKLAVDTGATHTAIHADFLSEIGYSPQDSPNKTHITTGSGVDYVPVLPISKIEVLGREQRDLFVTAVSLPDSATVDGVIGLDFFRGRKLFLDFREGILTLD